MSGFEAAIGPFFDWLAANPAWAGAVIGLIAFLESLALVGLLVPGAVLMLMAGAIVGASNLALIPILLWAMAGAIAGDGLSYWLGRHFRDRLRRFPVIRRYPGAINQAEQLFYRHGGKSVFIGRFVGPVRPVIPAVVGMLGMPPGRFLLANVGSAIAWAPAYLLPGVVFGASIMLAMEVMGRLMAWLVIAVGGFLLLRWLLPRLDRPLRLAGSRLARAVGREPPRGVQWAWLRPPHAALRSLRHREGWLWWLALFLVPVTWLEAIIQPGPQDWERGLLALAHAQRTPLVQEMAWRVTQLGGLLSVAVATLALAAALWWRGQIRRAGLVIVAVGLAKALAYAGKAWLATPRPLGLTEGMDFAGAFPSAHAAGIAALITAWVVILPQRERYTRFFVLLFGGLLALTVAISRLVLGVHWPLDVMAGLALGITLGALPGVIAPQGLPARRQSLAVLASAIVLTAAAGIAETLNWPDHRGAYPGRSEIAAVSLAAWREDTAGVAERRLGLLGVEEAFAAQWYNADTGFAALTTGDWTPSRRWGWRGLLRWISPQPSGARLPVLPRFHEGRRPQQVFLKLIDDSRDRWVLRAWRGADTARGPIWLLALEYEQIRGGVLLPRLERRFATREEVRELLSAAAKKSELIRVEAAGVPRYSPGSLPQGDTRP